MILDTNALSAVADGDPAVEPILREATEVTVPVIVLGEFRYGIRQSRGRAQYERWLVESIPSYRVLKVDEETAERYAEVRDQLKRRGRPIPANELWIAALARQHSLPLLSRDQHFDSVPGLRRLTKSREIRLQDTVEAAPWRGHSCLPSPRSGGLLWDRPYARQESTRVSTRQARSPRHVGVTVLCEIQ